MREGFARLFADHGVPVDAADPVELMLFPEMDAARDVPEITEACWGILGKSPDSIMCASQRMVVRRKGAPAPRVLTDWDEASCTQLVYLYTEVARNFGGDAKRFFQVTAKPRGRESDGTLAIASIDVGGGTTDLSLVGGNLYGAIVLWNGAAHTVIEWENATFKQTGQKVSFQLWIQDGTDNIWFSYPPGFNTALGTTTPSATVGAENLAGTQAAKYYYRGSSGSPTGTVPTGAVDVWVGLNPSTQVLSYQATASGPANSNMLNEATVTVSSTTNKAWANARICGPASATPTGINVVSWYYANLDWSAGGSPFNTYQVWRSLSPYFTPGGGGTTQVFNGKAFSFLDKNYGPTVGDPATNHFYVLRTVNCTGASTADSTPVGEFDFSLVPGQ